MSSFWQASHADKFIVLIKQYFEMPGNALMGQKWLEAVSWKHNNLAVICNKLHLISQALIIFKIFLILDEDMKPNFPHFVQCTNLYRQ